MEYSILKFSGILGNAAVISVIIGLGVFIGRNWLQAWLIKDAQHNFDKKLEEFKIELSDKTARELAAHSAGISAQTIGAEKRIEAVESFWNAICNVKQEISPAFPMFSFLTEEEYLQQIQSPEYVLSGADKDGMQYFRHFEELKVENLRPFISGKLWQLFFAYRAFLGRLKILEAKCAEGDAEGLWYNDNGVRQILSYAVTTDELEAALDTPFKSPVRVTELIEFRMIEEVHKIVNGEEFGKESFTHLQNLVDLSRNPKTNQKS